MFGWVEYHARGAEEPPLRRVGGVRFRAVYVVRGGGLGARLSARAAARTLAREGIRRALFPEDYAHCAAFERLGVGTVSPFPLRSALCARIVRRCMEQRALDPRRCTVLFAAQSVSRELRVALTELSGEVHGLALTAMRGGEELARALRRERGLALRLTAPGEMPLCDLNVLFSPAETAGERLPLYDPALCVDYDAALPERTLTALWELGALDVSMLRVRSVAVREVDGARKLL